MDQLWDRWRRIAKNNLGVVAEGEAEGMVAEMEEMKAQVREGRGWW